jgi:hypothetical protein
MSDPAELAVVGIDDDADVLSGDLVRDLVTRNEEEIEALLARLDAAERLAATTERSVRQHPAFAFLDPDEATRLVPGPPGPVIVDDGRPQTTVVPRSLPPACAAGGSVEFARPSRERPKGFVGRLTTSHWWWRIGIALVAVALLIIKVG